MLTANLQARATYSEDDIFSASLVVSPEMAEIEQSIQHLKNLKKVLLTDFAFIFATNYNLELGNEVVYDVKKIAKDIKAIHDYRLGVKRATERADSSGQVVHEKAVNSSCCVM